MRSADIADPCKLHPGDMMSVHEHWDTVRRSGPVAWSSRMEAWLVTSHAEALVVFNHPDLGSEVYSSARPSPLPLPSSFELDIGANRRLQQAVASCIGRRVLPMDIIGSGCAELVARAPLEQSVEFASELAEPIARALVRRWFGFDEGTLTRLLALLAVSKSDPVPERRAAASRLVIGDLLAAIAACRHRPTRDLLGRLAAAWSRHDADDKWLVAFVAPMFYSLVRGLGGRLITHAALHLTQRPDLQQRIRDGGWDTARAVALEAARLDPINQAAPRRAHRALMLGGQRIAANDRVWIVLPAVCRDPDAHPEPHEFRLDRRNRHLAFGHGMHVCTGRELALAVAATALTELLICRGVSLRPAPDETPQFRIEFGRSCVRLPLVLHR
jgi:cytochrome P450